MSSQKAWSQRETTGQEFMQNVSNTLYSLLGVYQPEPTQEITPEEKPIVEEKTAKKDEFGEFLGALLKTTLSVLETALEANKQEPPKANPLELAKVKIEPLVVPSKNQGNIVSGEYYDRSQKISKAITPTDPEVRNLAGKLATQFPGNYNYAQICVIWYALKENWRYFNDPRGHEYLASTSESIKLNGGDCDDFAILMSSLIESIGGTTRVIFSRNSTSGHAYCEVYISKNIQDAKNILQKIVDMDAYYKNRLGKPVPTSYKMDYRMDKQGRYWLNMDWQSNYPGGERFPGTSEVAFYPSGKYEILK